LRLAGANPRDQMTKAEKRNSADAYAGKVEYGYCLTCGGALAYRKEYSTTVSTTITGWKRYEYDGINLLRVDEKYDTAGGTIDAGDPWRTLEVNTHRPGMLGNLLGKRFYVHTNNDATPDGTYDYFYGYDRVGNLVFVYEGGGSGDEAFYFTQDAFGNQLALGNFNGDSWATARGVGVTEHQTGKWLDPFTGMYYFYARWYDSEVGRWVSRDSVFYDGLNRYAYCRNAPAAAYDPDGSWTTWFGINPYKYLDCMDRRRPSSDPCKEGILGGIGAIIVPTRIPWYKAGIIGVIYAPTLSVTYDEIMCLYAAHETHYEGRPFYCGPGEPCPVPVPTPTPRPVPTPMPPPGDPAPVPTPIPGLL